MRPSTLPKLALCGQYQSAPGEAGPAAQRGTMLDKVFRDAWQTGECPRDLSDEDAQAVMWAINALIRCRTSERDQVQTNEDATRIKYIPMLPNGGTADAVCLGGRWLADLKSGQVYDYRAQMAAYALGLMVQEMEQEWTCHLLFCDQQRVVTHRFTFAEARDIVASIVANVGTPPVINDYCGWCAHSLTCSARVAASESALAVQPESFAAVLADPARLGEFLTRCRTFDDFREAAETEARRLLGEGVEVHGWRLQKPRVSEFVDAEILEAAVASGQINAVDVIRAHGSMSAAKARKLWADVPVARKESKPALVACK